MILASEFRIPLWDVGAGLSDETVLIEVPCRSSCGTIKIPPCSKGLSAEHRPKFAALACHRQWWQPPDSWKIVRVAINKQTKFLYCIYVYNEMILKRYQRVISLKTQIGITNQRNKWANTDTRYIGGGIRCLGGVSIPCWSITPALSPVPW
jgi:hypothetical protein